MFSNEIASHLFLTLVYFLVLSLFRWKLDLSLFWLWLGAFLGMFLLDADHLLYWFSTHEGEMESRQAKVLLKTENFKGLYRLLKATHEAHVQLIFHTATFQIVLLVLSFYVLTSGGSVLGSAFVLSLNLHLLKDEWFDFFGSGRERLAGWLFWQIKEFPAEKFLNLYLAGVSLAFVFLTLLF